MRKVINDTSTRYYYDVNDYVRQLSTNKEYQVKSVDIDKKTITTTTGLELELTPDVKPTEVTLKNCQVQDKRKRETDIIHFAKTKENATIPIKREEDACWDLYPCFDEQYIEIAPHEIKLIPTGIATAFDKKFKAIVYERGSSGSVGLAIRCGVIDSGFRNEWFIAISNVTNKTILISKETGKVNIFPNRIVYPYTKAIAQFALEIVPRVTTKEVTWEELKEIKSERGLGLLGSSGK